MFRQGDVLIIPISNLPVNLEEVRREDGLLVLAYGEATGHSHAIKEQHASLFRDPKLMGIFMRVSSAPVALVHDEHDSISIPPGDYEIIQQREYSPEEIRNVSD